MAFVTAPNQEKAKELASGLVRLVLRNLLIGTYLLFLDFFHIWCKNAPLVSFSFFQIIDFQFV